MKENSWWTILKRRRIMKEKETDVGRSPIQQSYLYPYLWFVLWRFLWGLQPYAKEKKTIPEVMSITLQKHNSRTQIIIKCEGNDHLSVNVWTKAFNGRSLSSTDRSSHNWYYNRLNSGCLNFILLQIFHTTLLKRLKR